MCVTGRACRRGRGLLRWRPLPAGGRRRRGLPAALPARHRRRARRPPVRAGARLHPRALAHRGRKASSNHTAKRCHIRARLCQRVTQKYSYCEALQIGAPLLANSARMQWKRCRRPARTQLAVCDAPGGGAAGAGAHAAQRHVCGAGQGRAAHRRPACRGPVRPRRAGLRGLTAPARAGLRGRAAGCARQSRARPPHWAARGDNPGLARLGGTLAR